MNQLKQLINQLHLSIQYRKPHIIVASKIYKLSYIVNNYDQYDSNELTIDIIDLIHLISNDRTVSSETIQIFSGIIIYGIDNNLFDRDNIDYLSQEFAKMKL